MSHYRYDARPRRMITSNNLAYDMDSTEVVDIVFAITRLRISTYNSRSE